MQRSFAAAIVLVLVGLSVAIAQRTPVSKEFPIYENEGKPDLTVDPKRFVSQMEIVDRRFELGDCELEEGTVGGAGYRRLLRFDTVIINAGDGDLVVGDPADPDNPYSAYFDFAPCHGHYHNRDFSNYQLLTLDGHLAAPGHKQAFCLEDSLKYANESKSNDYNCGFQGITTGWGDWYYKQLSGQWIDITGVPADDYIVRVEVNAAALFDEGEDRYPDVIEGHVQIPDPRNKVAVDTSPLAYSK
jgi:Lysyl oxidase